MIPSNKENLSFTSKSIKFLGFPNFYNENPPLKIIKGLKYISNKITKSSKETIHVIVETNLRIILDGIVLYSLQATPLQIEGLIIGSLFNKGLIVHVSDIVEVEIELNGDVRIKSLKSQDDSSNRDNLDSKQLNELSPLTIKHIFQSQQALVSTSKFFDLTGAVHLAGLFSVEGKLLYYAEDMGRHNAIDKIIGLALIDNRNLSELYGVISGRLSEEIVFKFAKAGVKLLVSKAAPMFRGIECAKRNRMTLIGFARDPNFNIYSYPNRVKFHD